MGFSVLMSTIQEKVGSALPSILGAIGLLVLGWIVALILQTLEVFHGFHL